MKIKENRSYYVQKACLTIMCRCMICASGAEHQAVGRAKHLTLVRPEALPIRKRRPFYQLISGRVHSDRCNQ